MAERELKPVSGAVAWKGPDFARDDSWIHRVDDAEIAEIETALAGLPPTELQARRFSRDAFPLPVFGERLEQLLAQIQHGRGFALIRGLPLDRWDRQQIEAVYWGIGSYLGGPISQNGEGAADRGSHQPRSKLRQ